MVHWTHIGVLNCQELVLKKKVQNMIHMRPASIWVPLTWKMLMEFFPHLSLIISEKNKMI